MLEFFKEIIIRIIHNYQSAFNERKYWKRRLYVQKKGGAISCYYLMWLRRTEAKKCSNTGTGKPGNCCIFGDKCMVSTWSIRYNYSSERTHRKEYNNISTCDYCGIE